MFILANRADPDERHQEKVSERQALRLSKKNHAQPQLSSKFQLLIKTKIPTNKDISCFKSLRCCIYHVNK